MPERAHPLRLRLVLGDRLDDVVRDPSPGLEEVVLRLVGVREAVLVVGADPPDDIGLVLCAHASTPSATLDGRERLVALRLELVRELWPALGDDPAAHEDVDVVRLDVAQDALIVRDQERAHVGADEGVHAGRDDPERVDVETGVGLVEDGDLRLEHRELEHLDPLALAT